MQGKENIDSIQHSEHDLFTYLVNKYNTFDRCFSALYECAGVSQTIILGVCRKLVDHYAVTIDTPLVSESSVKKSTSSPVLLDLSPGDKYNARLDDNCHLTNPKTSPPRVAINIDWITFRLDFQYEKFLCNLDGADAQQIDDYFFEYVGHGTNIHRWCFNVYHGDLRIGQLCTHPHQAHIDFSTFKLDNRVLYDKRYMGHELSDYRTVTSSLFKVLEADVLGLSRLDICLDGLDLTPFIADYQYDKTYLQLNRKNVQFNTWDREKGLNASFTVGRRTGKKYGVYYDKTKEIFDGDNKKYYITEWHKACGLDIEKNINRFEIRLNSEALRDMEEFDWHLLFCEGREQYLASILDFQLLHFFQFVPKVHTDSRVSRRPIIKLIDLSNLATSEFTRVKRTLTETTRSVKIVVKRLLNSAFRAEEDTSELFLRSAAEYVSEYMLYGWLKRKSEDYIKEFTAHCRRYGVLPSSHFHNVTDLSTFFNPYNDVQVEVSEDV